MVESLEIWQMMLTFLMFCQIKVARALIYATFVSFANATLTKSVSQGIIAESATNLFAISAPITNVNYPNKMTSYFEYVTFVTPSFQTSNLNKTN